jgi:hypothetical protein
VGIDAQLHGFTIVDHHAEPLVGVRPFEVDDRRSPVVEYSFEVAHPTQLDGSGHTTDGELPHVREVGLGAGEGDAAIRQCGEQGCQ